MILQLLIALFASKINRHQDQVIAYLREENHILKAKLKGQRIPLTDTERRRLAVPVSHPRKASPMQREHDPPGPNALKPAILTRRPCYGRRVSKARQAAAVGVVSCESNSDDVAGCAQRRGSCTDSYQTAA